MTERSRLPNRRPSMNVSVDWQHHSFALTVGFDPDRGRIAEVFYGDGQKTGTDLLHTVQDACVIISVALQYGIPLEALGRSLGTAPGLMGVEGPASPIGAVVAVLDVLAREMDASLGHGAEDPR